MEPKNLNGVLLLGACVVVMPASIGVWDVCEGSDITDGAFVKMRGRNTRTAGHRVFLFIVKNDIKIFVWSVDKTTTYRFDMIL